MCPGNHQSGARTVPAPTRHGGPCLKRYWARSRSTPPAAKAPTCPPATGASSRRGKKRALVAVGHSVLIAVWTMLTRDQPYQDLGPDYFTQRLDPQHRPIKPVGSSNNSTTWVTQPTSNS